MPAPLHFRKANINGVAALVPTDEEAEAWLKRRKIGDAVAMTAEQVRNAERSALYWVLCSIVAENHGELKDREAVSDALKILGGLTRVVAFDTSGGRIFKLIPKSIAFASMGEDEFERYFETALRIIGSDLLPGCDIEGMRQEAYLRSGNIEKSDAVRREMAA